MVMLMLMVILMPGSKGPPQAVIRQQLQQRLHKLLTPEEHELPPAAASEKRAWKAAVVETDGSPEVDVVLVVVMVPVVLDVPRVRLGLGARAARIAKGLSVAVGSAVDDARTLNVVGKKRGVGTSPPGASAGAPGVPAG